MVKVNPGLRTPAIISLAMLLLAAPTAPMPFAGGGTPDSHSRVSLKGAPIESLTAAGPATDLPGATPVTAPDLPAAGPAATAPSARSSSAANVRGPGAADDLVVSLPVARGGVVGLTWPSGTANVTGAAVRTLGATGWSQWYLSPVEAVVDPAGGRDQRPGTEPFWVGLDVTRIQVRLAAAARSSFETGQLDVFTPGTSPAPSGPAARAAAAPVQLSIVTRSQWGADETLRNGCVPDWADTTRAATVHHTAGTNTYTPEQAPGIVRGIMSYHITVRGWCDIGYHALVDKYGTIYEGRIGGLTNPIIGAHTLGFNRRNFGVSVMGDFTTTDVPAAAVDSVAKVIAMRFHDFYVNPNGTATLTSADSGSLYPAGTEVTVPTIDGHRDFQSTACPGAKLYAALPTIRAKVAALVLYTDSDLYARYQVLGGKAVMGEIGMGEATLFGHRHLGYANGWGTWTRADGSFIELGPAFDRFFAQWGAASWGDPLPEKPVPGGVSLEFTGTSVRLVWSPETGTGMVLGAIRTYWEKKGALQSWIGMPVEQEIVQPGGVSQQFSVGRVWWSPTTGAFTTLGAIGSRYAALGPAVLGFPTSEDTSVAPDGGRQRFQRGWIYWSPGTGAHPTWGAIHSGWQAGGGVTWLGYPTSDEATTSPTGVGQDFERGSIYWSSTTPAIAVYRGIHTVYVSAGGPGGCLGYPIAGESQATAGAVSQKFQHGSITFPLDGRAASFVCAL